MYIHWVFGIGRCWLMLAFWVTSIFQKNPSWKKNVVPETEKPRWLSRAPCTWSTMWRVREPCEISERVWFSQTAILLTVYNERFVRWLMFSPFARLHATVTDCKKRMEHHHYWSNNAIFFAYFWCTNFALQDFCLFIFTHGSRWLLLLGELWCRQRLEDIGPPDHHQMPHCALTTRFHGVLWAHQPLVSLNKWVFGA